LRDDFGLILAATLTLLALIIGFRFSMATARYDQRKNYEEQEANAIGTEYVRADLLSPIEAAKVRSLLGSYLDQRVLFMMNKSYCRSAPAPSIASRVSDAAPHARHRASGVVVNAPRRISLSPRHFAVAIIRF
jgi:hypothetical protein